MTNKNRRNNHSPVTTRWSVADSNITDHTTLGLVWLAFICLILPSLTASPLPSRPFDIPVFGAAGNDDKPDTRAIQAAIDAAAQNGGGTVEFPAGTWLSGTIYLKSHVRLNLAPGALLLGSPRVADYPLNRCVYPSYSDRYVGRALIWGEGLENIAITGDGTIDGQGHFFLEKQLPVGEETALTQFSRDSTRIPAGTGNLSRPFLIRLISCRNIRVENVTLQKSAKWLQHYLNCEFVTLRNLHIFNHGNVNNDLIDIDGCRNVVITGCFGDSDDDGITLKSTSAAATENVTISDCIIRTRTNAIKAGTESSGGFKDITITNCIFQPSDETGGFSGRVEGLAGIALESVDGGTLDRVTISNITMEDMAAPIYLRLGNRARKLTPEMATPPVGTFRNVNISNVVATRAGDTGCSILGIEGHFIENVTLSNIRIHFDGGGTRALADAEIPEKDAEYPESTRFGPLPAYGFYCRHVSGLTFRDVVLDFELPELRPSLVCNDVRNLKLFNFNGQISADVPQIRLQNTHDVFISGCQPSQSDIFLRLERACDAVTVMGNNFTQVQQPFSLDETVTISALHAINNLPDPTASAALFMQLAPGIQRDALGVVTMNSFAPNTEIRFTRNGAEPTPSSPKYSQPFEQIAAGEIRARIFQGNQASRCTRATFDQLPVIQPEIHPADVFFDSSVVVTLLCKTPGAKIHYTLEGSAPTETAPVYRLPLQIDRSTGMRVRAFKSKHRPSAEVPARFEAIPRQPGVLYRYFPGKWEKLPNLIYMQPAKIGVVSQFRLAGIETGESDFALLLIGFLTVPQSGKYTFFCGSNDGSQLTVDNTRLIDNDELHGFQELSGEIELAPGRHRVEVRYFQGGGAMQLKVSWQGPGFGKRELSAEDLRGE